MSDDPRLTDLLLRWEESAEDGRRLSPGELCRHCPELLPTLEKRIAMLRAVDGALDAGTMDLPATLPAPPAAGAAARVTLPGYEVLGELGRGGMGVVYKARQVSLDRVVAVKMIRSGAHAGPQERARFRSEAEAVARLQHPNIVQVFDSGEQDGCPFLTLEFVDGGSLADRLDGTPVPPGEAARLVQTLAAAIHAAHQRGIVHRDLKPGNVLVAADGTPRITDFGLAKLLDRDRGLSRTGDVMGTPSYMAPEQAGGKSGGVGPATDVYALGAILYELLTGRPPFKAATPLDTLMQVLTQEPVPPSRLQPGLPRDLETVCLKCLAKEPWQRYPDAGSLAADLGRFLRGEPTEARPLGPAARSFRWARRKPLATALVGVSIAAAVSLVVVGLAYNSRLREAKRAAEEQAEAARVAQRDAEQALAALSRARTLADERSAIVTAVTGQLKEVQQRLALNYLAYGRACALASRLANAARREDVRADAIEFHRVADWLAVAGDEKIATAAEAFERAWNAGEPAATLQQKSLGLARACRQTGMCTVAKEFPSVEARMRSQLYARACGAAAALAAAPSWEAAQEARREFWELYWGEMYAFESARVEVAMVRFGRALYEWHRGKPPPELTGLAEALRAACDGDRGPVRRG